MPSWLYVKNSGGFTPASLPNLQVWLDVQDFSTITKDGSDNVSQVDDKSGNNNDHVPNMFPSESPIYTASGINSFPSLTFDFTRPSSLHSVNSINNLTEWSVYVVNQFTTDGVAFAMLTMAGGAGGIWKGDANTAESYETSTGSYKDFSFVKDLNVANLVQIIATTNPANERFINIDDEKNGTGTSGSSWDMEYVNIGTNGVGGGTTGAFNGLVGEVIVYDVAHDDPTRALVVNYLKNKWNIA